MNKVFENIVIIVAAVFMAGVLGLLLAFPIKWCWNSAVVHVWDLPIITWGQAWCLNFLAGMLIQSSYSHASNQ